MTAFPLGSEGRTGERGRLDLVCAGEVRPGADTTAVVAHACQIDRGPRLSGGRQLVAPPE